MNPVLSHPEEGIAGDPLFREHILDHYRHPRNFGRIIDCHGEHRGLNPLCGDEICIYVNIAHNIVQEIKFTGQGCAISLAAASLLTEAVQGKSLEAVQKLDRESVLTLLGIPVSPARIKCALLSLHVLAAALNNVEEPTC